jgi:glycopeptide antibiotics resistance protein
VLGIPIHVNMNEMSVGSGLLIIIFENTQFIAHAGISDIRNGKPYGDVIRE